MACRRACVPGTWSAVSYLLARRASPYCLCGIERFRSARWFDWGGGRFRLFRLVTVVPFVKRVRGRKPHDPGFDVRTALYLATGVDLTAIEGIDEINALTLVSELGSDFTKWPTVKHSSSWLGLCPNFQKTGGKVKSSRTRRGKGRAAHTLRLAAWSLMRSTGALGGYLRRQRSRLGAPKAITAAAHKLARIVYHLMRYGEAYVRRTEEAYAQEVRERQERQLQRRARELGFEVNKIEAPPSGEAGAAGAATAV